MIEIDKDIEELYFLLNQIIRKNGFTGEIFHVLRNGYHNVHLFNICLARHMLRH